MEAYVSKMACEMQESKIKDLEEEVRKLKLLIIEMIISKVKEVDRG